MRFFEAKAYGLHETSNPLFPRVQTKAKFWPLLGLGVLLLGLVAGLCEAVYGPYLRLQNVNVVGTVTLNSDDLKLQVLQDFSQTNYFIFPNGHRWFFKPQRSINALQAKFPIKSVQVERQGSDVTISIVEDVFMVALLSGDEVYMVDREGKITGPATPEEKAAVLVKAAVVSPPADPQSLATLQSDMPIFKDKSSTLRSAGDAVLSTQKIENVLTFQQGLKDLGIEAHEFVSDDLTLPWFAVTSNQSFLILFDAVKDPAEQIQVLQAIMADYLSATEKPGYIDLRFGTRVYIK